MCKLLLVAVSSTQLHSVTKHTDKHVDPTSIQALPNTSSEKYSSRLALQVDPGSLSATRTAPAVPAQGPCEKASPLLRQAQTEPVSSPPLFVPCLTAPGTEGLL